MQNRELTGLILEIFTEQISGVSYVKFLSTQAVETLKLPTTPEKYKYKHLLSAKLLLTIEVVQTRKNWILTSIHHFEEILELKHYSDFLKYSEVIHYLNENLRVEEKTDWLPNWLHFLQTNNFQETSTTEIKNFIDQKLGFR